MNYYLYISVANPHLSAVHDIISSQERLDEVVGIVRRSEAETSAQTPNLVVEEDQIHITLQWSNETPPYLFPAEIPFDKNNLLAFVYTQLGNFEAAYEWAAPNPTLLQHIDTFNRLKHGILTSPTATNNTYVALHNEAVLQHYGVSNAFVSFPQLISTYEAAINAAPNDEYRAFTIKQLATLLLDEQYEAEAEKWLQEGLAIALSEEATAHLRWLQCNVWLNTLNPPYDEGKMMDLKNGLWQCITYFEQRQESIPLALLLTDAARVATYTESFAEALGYIQRAENLLRAENLPELLANVQYQKGILLYTWAQHGNPQFYKGSMEAFQAALKVFKQTETPEIFAEIQHYLGVIYSEIPDEIQKKSLWAAVSVSSFKQALEYFTPQTHPYEYAKICTSYANALTKYPAGVLSDNYLKALHFYREALTYRPADELPTERVLTGLNFLEAAWQVDLSHQSEEETAALLNEMDTLTTELASLATEPSLTAAVQEHQIKLAELRQSLATSNP